MVSSTGTTGSVSSSVPGLVSISGSVGTECDELDVSTCAKSTTNKDSNKSALASTSNNLHTRLIPTLARYEIFSCVLLHLRKSRSSSMGDFGFLTATVPGTLNVVEEIFSFDPISSERINAPDDIPFVADDFCQPFLLVLRSLISFRLLVTESKDCCGSVDEEKVSENVEMIGDTSVFSSVHKQPYS